MQSKNTFTIYVVTIALLILSVKCEPICKDEEGNIIPCKKVVDRIDDFDLQSSNKLKKRGFYVDWLTSWFLNPWSWFDDDDDDSSFWGAPTNNGVNVNVGKSPTTTKTIPKSNKTLPTSTKNKTIPLTTKTKTIPVTTRTKTIPKTTTSSPKTIKTSTSKTIPKTNTHAPQATSTSSNDGLGLDRKPLKMKGFINCNAEQKRIIERTINDIITYRAAGLKIAKDTSDAHAKEIFKKYFKNEKYRNKVVKLLENVNNRNTVDAYCETNADDACREQAIAWTYLKSNQFHVCPAFFTKVLHGTINKHTSEAASVILHELTHCHGTDDFAYGEDKCAALNGAQSSNNADTFRLFCMKSIYYLNDKRDGVMKFALDDNIDFRAEPFHDKVIIRKVKRK